MAKFWADIVEKLNPVQPIIAQDEGTNIGTLQNDIGTVTNAYELLEIVSRSVNLLVDNASMVEYDVAGSLAFTGQVTGLRNKTLKNLLNSRPNPYMDISTFKRLLFMDFIIDGNCFIHFDGSSLYHIPADKMEIIPDQKHYINSFVYNGQHRFSTNEILHIKDNNLGDQYRGRSRINSALSSILTIETMQKFQKNFFENGAAVGLILETDEVLNKKLKDRQEREWTTKFNPTRGANKPVILDNGMKARSVANTNFNELSFNESMDKKEEKVCVALGIPPILLNSGNNANIKPNLELLFYTTILPMTRKFEAAFEYFFGYDIEVSTHAVPALKPDQKAQAEYLSALVNNGLMIGNEARVILRLEELDDPLMKKIRVPANVAGSGTGVTGQEGGKPPSDKE
jgi:HK97 family phage portal protein|tara:strand:- start:785 stop:1981 length:1197 start_codon:yes stop_codon:yes gene_type:complete